jgi:hypothetical protein
LCGEAFIIMQEGEAGNERVSREGMPSNNNITELPTPFPKTLSSEIKQREYFVLLF